MLTVMDAFCNKKDAICNDPQRWLFVRCSRRYLDWGVLFGPVLQRGKQFARRLPRVNYAWLCFGNEHGI